MAACSDLDQLVTVVDIDQNTMNALPPIAEIMRRHGCRCSPEEFHGALNVLFHDFEAEVYDEGHRDMWESLPAQVELLVADCIAAIGIRDKLAVLDIGCGTGLASHCAVASSLGSRIASIDLLDTSSIMLQRALRRGQNWGVPVVTHRGTVDALPRKQYDMIVTCSVLHHIPDLQSFLARVEELQAPGGIFIHLQDPNGDHLNDPDLQERIARKEKKFVPESISRLSPKRVLGRLYRQVIGQQGQDYLSRTNRELLNRGIVQTPLSVAEIFEIIDIHVQDGAGISIQQMKAWMPGHRLISQRAYGFFGHLWSSLPTKLKAAEEQMIAARALNGFHIAAAWHKP